MSVNFEEFQTDIECFVASKPKEIYARGINNLSNTSDCLINNKIEFYLY